MEYSFGFIIFVKLVSGIVSGFLPLLAGFLKANPKLAWKRFWLCFMIGTFIDAFAAILVSVLFALLILTDKESYHIAEKPDVTLQN